MRLVNKEFNTHVGSMVDSLRDKFSNYPSLVKNVRNDVSDQVHYIMLSSERDAERKYFKSLK